MEQSLYTGVAAVSGGAQTVVPGAAVLPGVALLPGAQAFGSWRVLLLSATLLEPAQAGASVVITGNVWDQWGYGYGVNPAVEPLPLLAVGTRFWIDAMAYTLTAPVWPSGPGNGPVAWEFEPPLPVDLSTDAVVWLFIERLQGACRMLDSGALGVERLNATLIALGTAINALADGLWVTWEGAQQVEAEVVRAGQVSTGAAFVRPVGGGDYVPVLVERGATRARAGLVRQAEAVADATWGPDSTGTLWETLAALQSAAAAAGWLEVQ